MLTRDQILSRQELATKTVDVPAWGGKIKLRELTAAEKLKLGEMTKDADNIQGEDALRYLCTVLVMSAVNGKGSPLFKPADVERLCTKNMEAVLELGNAALELSGLGDAKKN